MKTTHTDTSGTYREKGSKFIGYLRKAERIERFEQALERIKSDYPDATHHCYAYRIDPTDLHEFAQDDGEPGGTAGLPILNALKSFEAVNCGIIVVRYYGGTNLGKSGLIRAYGHTARLCLEKAELTEIVRTRNLELRYPYSRQNQVDRLSSVFGLRELDAEYLEEVSLTLACPADRAPRLFEELDRLSHLEIRYERLGEHFIPK